MSSYYYYYQAYFTLLLLIFHTNTITITKADENFLRRRLQLTQGYKYSQGNCPNVGSTGLVCAPEDLGALCDSGNLETGSFMACWEACKPAYCCVSDVPADTNYIAPSCSTDENCAQYVFRKLGDTIGPQTYLRMQYQNDDAFFDFEDDAQFYDKVKNPMGDTFWEQLVFHHFSDVEPIIFAMRDPETGDVDVNKVFDDPEYWSIV